MKFNPFRPGNIVAPGMFVGRIDELHAIEQCLYQTSHGNPHHFLILGERGIGKSSLLMLVDGIARGAVKPLYSDDSVSFLTISVDMGGVDSQTDIIRTIARELRTILSRTDALKAKAIKTWEFLQHWEVLGVRYHAEDPRINSDDERDNLAERIIQLIESTKGSVEGVCIIVDEADRPEPHAQLGEFVKLFS